MPMSQAILMETFPPEEQAAAMSVWGTRHDARSGDGADRWAAGSPTTIAGAGFSTSMCRSGVDRLLMVTIFVARPGLLSARGSSGSIGGVSAISRIGVIGTIQIMLDKGERLDWFDSPADHGLWRLSARSQSSCSFSRSCAPTSRSLTCACSIIARSRSAWPFITIVMFAMYGTYGPDPALLPADRRLHAPDGGLS